jgi:hypothetical protein
MAAKECPSCRLLAPGTATVCQYESVWLWPLILSGLTTWAVGGERA